MSAPEAAGVTSRLAIFAHYDSNGDVHEHVLELLRQVREVASDIIIVSTNLNSDGAAKLEPFGTVLVKSNLGYDFASWRLGIEEGRRRFQFARYSEIITLNDSFYLLRDRALADACADMRNKPVDVWSLTASRQILFHLQSYFICFRPAAFQSAWFDRFWSAVWEYGERSFVVAQYELSLTRQAQKEGLNAVALFDPAVSPDVPPIERGVNPTHVLWEQVARSVGIAKVELVQRNPHNIDFSALEAIAEPKQLNAISVHSSGSPAASVSPISPLDEAVQFAQHSTASVAVHVHLHYAELLDELMLATRQIPVPCDVYVTVTDLLNLGAIVGRIKAHRRDSRILVADNRGRDILPFLSLLNAGVFAPYAAVCKVHSKRSTYSPRGDEWRRSLIGPLLGSSTNVLDVLDAFSAEKNLGLVVPQGSFVSEERHWGGNRTRVEAAAERMRGGIGTNVTPLAFPAGSMYWFRPAAMEPLRQLRLSPNDFEPEAGAQDATMAHVVERLIAISTWASGHIVVETGGLGTALSADGADRSTIPVLELP